MRWSHWRRHFERNQQRPLPAVTPARALPPAQARALAWSLARFQIGEVGEGRIAREIWRVRLPGIDDDYRVALGLFVKEEGRHARILAAMVRALGGTPLARSGSQRLFRIARGLMGARTKLLMFFAAEVIGIGCYRLLADALPRSFMRAALQQISDDEHSHLAFHRDFFRAVAGRGWRRTMFRAAWAVVAAAAASIVLIEHRRTLRVFRIPATAAWRILARHMREGRRTPVVPRIAALELVP